MAREQPTLIVIDGYSLLFRAHLAYGSAETLRTRDGRPTGAIHGFTSMLLSILREQPDAIYVAWDAPGPTFRDGLFEEYKAHRPEADPDLKAQFGPARTMVEAFGIPSAEVEGFEADDLVGALADEGVRNGYRVIIYTGDSDQLQLVRDGVIVRMTGRGVSETTDYNAERVVEKYGVRPEQFADFKALVGDPSDNIPGVPNIGKVTAARLLQQWGSVENLLAHVEELPEKSVTEQKVKAALREYGDRARLARSLTQIRCDAPLERPLRRYVPTPETWENVRRQFADLEFRALAQRLPSTQPSELPLTPPETVPELTWEIITSAETLEAAIAEVRRKGTVAIVLDTDGNGALDARWRGLAFAADPERAWYVPVRTASPDGGGLLLSDDSDAAYAAGPSDLAPLLCDAGIHRLAHDAKSALITLARHGVEPGDYVFDTALAAYLLNPGSGRLALAKVAERFLRVEERTAASREEGACRSAASIAALEPVLAAKLRDDNLEEVYRLLDLPLVPVLAGMELKGIQVDQGWLQTLSEDLGRRIAETAEAIYDMAGERFLISSTQQLQHVLFDKLGLPAGRRTKTGRTTSADHLESLAGEYPIVSLILRYRELTKLKSTYADTLPRLVRPASGRLHTSLNQMVTSTGRLSSSDPNLQNIPVRSEEGRQIRRAFVAPPGRVLLSCDYSQIELRVFAHVTEDPEMLRAFAADEDIHTATATRVFGVPASEVTPEMRRRAKTVNFAVIYGQSPFGLAQNLGIPVEEARSFIASYFHQFPGVQAWTRQVLEEARSRGYVETLLGRRRYLPDLRSNNRNVREAAERAAVNMPIQGTAADIMKLAMLAVWHDQQRNSRPWDLVLQVHDELLLEVDTDRLGEAASVITELMENAFALRVRLKVDAKAGTNWADMEAVQCR